MMRGNFNNSLKLFKLIIRRERVISSIWLILLVAISMGLTPAMAEMFPDPGARNTFAASINNPIMIAMMGPVYGAGDYTNGAMYGGMMFLWYMIAVAIMNIFLVVRHTRADEEYGRTEVVRSLPTGRLANINAAMISALIINIILGLFTGLGLAAMGVEGVGFWGSMLYGAGTAAAGLVFAAIAALFSQLSSSSSGATAFSLVSVGVFYILRAAGDVQGNEIVSCISPFGLAQRIQVFVENRIWPIAALLVIAAVISAVAYKLNSIRDIGRGLIAARPGRAIAKPGLLSPFGLAWRLLRPMLISWAVVMFVLGAAYASVVADISSFIGDSPEYMIIIGIPVEMLDSLPVADQERLIVESFGSFVTLMMSLVCVVPLICAVIRVRSEERDGHAENVLTRSVKRWRYMAGYVTLAFLASIVMQFLTAIGLYYTAALMTGGSSVFTYEGLLATFFAYIPALWVMIGLAALVVGLAPKATGFIWGYFGVACFVSFIGRLVLPEWLLKISPFQFIPQPQPFEEFAPSFAPLLGLTIISAVLTAIGFIAYRKRDIAAQV